MLLIFSVEALQDATSRQDSFEAPGFGVAGKRSNKSRARKP